MTDRNHHQQSSISNGSNEVVWVPRNGYASSLEPIEEVHEAQLRSNGYHHVNDSLRGPIRGPSSYTSSNWQSQNDFTGYLDQPLSALYQSNNDLFLSYSHQPIQQTFAHPYAYFNGPPAPGASPYVHQYADIQDDGNLVDHETEMPPPPSRQTPQRKTRGRAASNVPDGQPKSKRAERRAQIYNQLGSVGATDHAKGTTRTTSSGSLEWYNPETTTWNAAAPLDDYRRRIIDEDSTLGQYLHEPERGIHQDDVTTLPWNDPLEHKQKDWNLKDRKNGWADVKDKLGYQVLYLIDRPDKKPETPEVGFMMYDNKIMLDPDDNPIIDWPGIPRLFSSALEGSRIEALRRIYPWLSIYQFRARMPRWVTKKTVGVSPLHGLSSLQQRISRFRQLYDCPAWKKVVRGSSLAEHTRERLAQQGLSLNSTEGLEPLTRREVLRRKKAHVGQYPENAGINTLTEEEKIAKAAREDARWREAQAKKEEAQAKASATVSAGMKRKREDDSDLDSSMQPAQK